MSLLKRLYTRAKSYFRLNTNVFHPFIFNSKHYVEINPALANLSSKDLKNHWATVGIKNGLCASKCFDVKYYLAVNKDLGRHFKNDYRAAMKHWLLYGIAEGRVSSPVFDYNAILENETHDLPNYEIISHWISNVDNKIRGNASVNKLDIESKFLEQKKEYQKLTKTRGAKEFMLAENKNALAEKYNARREASWPKVSVIMPCWNRRSTIEKSIDSILSQTYSNYELIISDDGSEDDTLHFIDSVCKKEIQAG